MMRLEKYSVLICVFRFILEEETRGMGKMSLS
jgi:hypothetical protein